MENPRERRGEERHEAEGRSEEDGSAPLPDCLAEDDRVGPGREAADERLGDERAADRHIGLVEAGAAGIGLVGSATDPREVTLGPLDRFGGEDEIPLARAGVDPHEHDLGAGDPPARDRVGLHGGAIGDRRICRHRDPVKHLLEAGGGLAPPRHGERRGELGEVEALQRLGDEMSVLGARVDGQPATHVAVNMVDRVAEAAERGPRARGVEGRQGRRGRGERRVGIVARGHVERHGRDVAGLVGRRCNGNRGRRDSSDLGRFIRGSSHRQRGLRWR